MSDQNVKSRSLFRKLLGGARSKSDPTPCNSRTTHKDNTKKEITKELEPEIRRSLSGKPLWTKSEPTTSTSSTLATGVVTLTRKGKAHTGRRWMPGSEKECDNANQIPRASLPISTGHNGKAPPFKSRTRVKDQYDGFSDPESETEEASLKAMDKRQSLMEFLNESRNELVESGIWTGTMTPSGSSTLDMSDVLPPSSEESNSLEFCTVNPAIQAQIELDRSNHNSKLR
jgi:hypothetical protein